MAAYSQPAVIHSRRGVQQGLHLSVEGDEEVADLLLAANDNYCVSLVAERIETAVAERFIILLHGRRIPGCMYTDK